MRMITKNKKKRNKDVQKKEDEAVTSNVDNNKVLIKIKLKLL